MKTYKFRIWDKVEKKMHYTSLAHYDSEYQDINFSVEGELGERRWTIDFHDQEGDLELMMWTGLLDCKWEPVYEGDVIAKNEKYPYEVIWSKKNARFILKRGKFHQAFSNQSPFEVIGNIWEHKHLLK